MYRYMCLQATIQSQNRLQNHHQNFDQTSTAHRLKLRPRGAEVWSKFRPNFGATLPSFNKMIFTISNDFHYFQAPFLNYSLVSRTENIYIFCFSRVLTNSYNSV